MEFSYNPKTKMTTFIFGMEELPQCAERVMQVVQQEPDNRGACKVLELMLIDLQELKQCTFVSPTNTSQ